MALIQKQSIREQVASVLLDRILSGEYPPGFRLRELELASEFGTSQGPVREAIRELAARRFLETVPNRGTHVREVPARELVEIYTARGALEQLACELSAPTTKDLTRLTRHADACLEAAKAGDAVRYARRDADFHRSIVELSGNTVLIRIWNDLRMSLRNRALVQKVGPSSELLTLLAEHHFEILDHFKNDDPAAAGQRLRDHLADVAHEIRRTTLGEPLDPLVPGDTQTGAKLK